MHCKQAQLEVMFLNIIPLHHKSSWIPNIEGGGNNSMSTQPDRKGKLCWQLTMRKYQNPTQIEAINCSMKSQQQERNFISRRYSPRSLNFSYNILLSDRAAYGLWDFWILCVCPKAQFWWTKSSRRAFFILLV